MTQFRSSCLLVPQLIKIISQLVLLSLPEASSSCSLFRNERLLLNLMLYRNASKIYHIFEIQITKTHSLFCFRENIESHKREIDKWNKGRKTIMWVFVFQKYGKFWNISLHHQIEHKFLYFWRMLTAQFRSSSLKRSSFYCHSCFVVHNYVCC